MGLLLKWLSAAISIFITAKLFGFIHVSSFGVTLVAALVLGVVNTIIKPLLIIFTLPINILTLGLFTFVINGIVLYMTSGLVPGFEITGLLGAIVAAVIISFINMIINSVID